MKLHRPVVEKTISALEQVFAQSMLGASADVRSQYSDRILEKIFKSQRQLGARDRRLIAESTYDIIRNWRLLWTLLNKNWQQIDPRDLWLIFGAWLVLGHHELPPWLEFSRLNSADIRERLTDLKSKPIPAVLESYPDWLYELGQVELGERWPQIASRLNEVAPVVLRANRLKITRELLLTELRNEGIETAPADGTADGLVLRERKNVFTSQAFRLGLFEVQDGASQTAATLLDVGPGDRVADCCAGAGGKTLHLAALMKNKGKIISFDVRQNKLEELRRRCTRAGVDIAEIRLIESSKTMKRMSQSFNRVLLDVPCSGLGVLRRNPDAKWRMTSEELARLRELQAEILENYSELTQPGGLLVYSTCSILPSENSEQVRAFLSRGNGWKLRSERQIWPGENGYDGFYTALLERLKI